jgi:hypothetical protein
MAIVRESTAVSETEVALIFITRLENTSFSSNFGRDFTNEIR